MTHDLDTGEITYTLYRRSADLGALFAALAKAQASFASASRDAENEGFKRGGKASRYATLESVIEATKMGLAENGLALLQMPGNQGTSITVTTILGHGESGQWVESTFAVAPSRFDAQGAGSVITYLRRYSRMAVCGIAPEDDDGNAASIEAPQKLGRPPPRRAGPFSKTYPAEQGFVTEPVPANRENPVLAESPTVVPNATLTTRAWGAARDGLWSLQSFCESLTRTERASIKRLVVDELQPFARRADEDRVADEQRDRLDELTERKPEEIPL
jgi:hypothetical protein